MAGRPKREGEVEVVFLRLPEDLAKRVTRCKGKIEMREGVSLNTTKAYCRILEAGCEALERTLEGSETPAPAQVSEIAEISSREISDILDIYNSIRASLDDKPASPRDADADEIPAPASPTNGTHAPAPEPPTQPAIPLALEPAPTTAPPVDVPQAAETRTAKTPARHGLPRETLQAIADEYTLCEGLSYSEFAQRLHDKGIYSATAKDGNKVPANRGNVKKWLDQAREAGLL